MNILIKVNEAVLILIGCNEECREVLLREVLVHSPHLLSIHLAILVLIERYEVVAMLLIKLLLLGLARAREEEARGIHYGE